MFEYLRLDLGYAYLDTELKELVTPVPPPDSPFSQLIPTAQLGQPLTLSPEHRVTAALTFTLPLPETIGKIAIGGTYVYTDEQIANAGMPASIGIIPQTDIVNANVNWTNLFDTNVDLAFFMTNVTDEEYPVNTGGGYVSSGIGDVLMGAPRMWGARVRYSFGN